jgi:hypothetical protein
MQTSNITILLILLINTVYMIIMMPEIGGFNFDPGQTLADTLFQAGEHI